MATDEDSDLALAPRPRAGDAVEDAAEEGAGDDKVLETGGPEHGGS